MTWLDRIHVGDCRATMRRMIAEGVRVQCVVTSPPYFGLRDYGHAEQIGLESEPGDYIETMRDVFELVRQVLADDGTLWLNLGDSYAGSGRGGHVGNGSSTLEGSTEHEQECKRARGSQLAPGLHAAAAAAAGNIGRAWTPPPKGFRQKNLLGIPWRVAFALQDAGWNLRSDIIWHKPNPMPESVLDRPTKSHEYLFLMSRSERYYYDTEAISELSTASTTARLAQVNLPNQAGSDRVPGKTNGNMKAVLPRFGGKKYGDNTEEIYWTKSGNEYAPGPEPRRNARTVWSIATTGFPGAHFATFPRDLVRRCILAGSRPGDTVLDPFMGSGTVAEVALSLGRHFIGCELNPEYAAMFETHRSQQLGMGV